MAEECRGMPGSAKDRRGAPRTAEGCQSVTATAYASADHSEYPYAVARRIPWTRR
jgi:hypothetical protein